MSSVVDGFIAVAGLAAGALMLVWSLRASESANGIATQVIDTNQHKKVA